MLNITRINFSHDSLQTVGSGLQVIGEIDLNVTVARRTTLLHFYVVEGVEHPVIGFPAIREMKIQEMYLSKDFVTFRTFDGQTDRVWCTARQYN
jgi:hypothetical protein